MIYIKTEDRCFHRQHMIKMINVFWDSSHTTSSDLTCSIESSVSSFGW